jgi:hypothetical protein
VKASAETKPAKKATAEPKLASLDKTPETKAPARKGPLIDDKLIGDIKDAAKAEKSRSAAGQ